MKSRKPRYAARNQPKAISSVVKPVTKVSTEVIPPAKVSATIPKKKGSLSNKPTEKDLKAARIGEQREKARAASQLALLNWPKPEDVSKLVPSSGQSLMICPSFFPFEREDQNTAAADEGKLMHEACATRTLAGLNEEQTKLVEMCLEYSREIEDGAYEVLMEREIQIPHMSRGYIDLFVSRDKGLLLHLFDYKFGRWPVADAIDNFQGWAYVEWALTAYSEAQSVVVHFLCPRIDEITAHTFTRADLPYIRRQIGEIQKNLALPPTERPHNFDPTNCDRCARAYNCPTIALLAESIVSYYDPQSMTQLSGELKYLKQRPSEITQSEQMARAFIVARALGNWVSSVKEHTTQFLLAGHEMQEEGVELGQKDGNRTLKGSDMAAIYKEFVTDKELLTQEEFFELCSVGLNPLLDACSAKSEKPTETKATVLTKLSAMGAVAYGTASFYAQVAKDVKKRSKNKN